MSDTKFSLQSIARLYVFRLIKGFRNYFKLVEYLQTHEEEAFQLGIYKNQRDNVVLPPKRTYNNYLKLLDRKQLASVAETILRLATQNKITLNLEIVKQVIKEKKKSYDREIREAIKLVKRLVYPEVDIKIKENGKFTTKDLLDVLVHVAFTHDFTNDGSNTFKEINNKEESPSGDLMMYHFSKFKSVQQLKEMSDKLHDTILNFAKKKYIPLNQQKLDVAYDFHKIPYYGDKNDPYVRGSKYDRGTSYFFEFLTCSITMKGQRFALDVIPLHSLSDISQLLDKSLDRVKNKIRINIANFDRWFDKPKIINVIKKNNVKFIMPKIKSKTVKAAFEKAENTNARVFHNFTISKGKKDEATVNLVLVDDEKGVKRAFICNFNIAPCLAFKLFKWYSKRWGIETHYRQCDHDFLARTTTKNYLIRFFYYIFSTSLYNLWILVNLCVSLLIYGRLKEKPIISAKMFTVILYKVQSEYFDNGG